jgi:F0F1-type ATP synthase membrane subunit b/b'
METKHNLNGINPFVSFEIKAQVVSLDNWLPILVLVILLLVIVALIYRNLKKNLNQSKASLQNLSLSDQNEQLKRNLAEIQARNQAELDRTRAILEQAQATGPQVVKETTEGIVRATREETERARAAIREAREQNLTELRREGAKIDREETPPEKPANPDQS